MVYCPSCKLTTWTDQTPAVPPISSAMIQKTTLDMYQMTEAVNHTSLCGQVKKSDCVGEHISLMLVNIHRFTPTWTQATKTVAINCAIKNQSAAMH